MTRAVDRVDEKFDKIKAATHEDADAKTLILRERRGVSPLVCRNVAENLSISANKSRMYPIKF